MTRLLVSLVMASMAMIGASAHAQDRLAKVDEPAPPEAVARFLMGTRLGYITCSGKYRTYLEKRDLYDLVSDGQPNPRMALPSNEEATACVHETMYKGKSLHDSAAKRTGTPAAKTALREYMTAWEASLTSLQPKQPEKPRDFDARQKKQEARLDELQKRVEATAK
ncbi:MAG TPA: hypothetical protein VFX81_09275 [Burkholderiaceae bacterium]|nr:hypothetical protein [Burkholderiaceae bacterium]